jgi:hypothetical protein
MELALLRREGRERWFLSFHVYARYIIPRSAAGPGSSGRLEERGQRYFHLHQEDELDEARFAGRVRQASGLPGEKM